MKYDVIVVGGGHAGCEACLATARIGFKTLLITGNIKNIADMPCNPSIGGSAKGIVVREIDALGGEMGINTDKTHIQIKFLNRKKGPGVRSLRAQADKPRYHEEMQKVVQNQKNLEIKEELAKELIVKNKEIKGIKLENGEILNCCKLILTTGTYMNSDILVGHTTHKGGPHGEKSSMFLSNSLKNHGLTIIRLKTGTPPRVLKSSIDFNKTKIEKGDSILLRFSNFFKPSYKVKDQLSCYLTYTNKETHKTILENLNKCALYSGMIKGVGPRYCPSIEDKIVKFKDKERHQIFLEPERADGDEIYVSGFSTTMPPAIQEKLIHTISGLEKAVITKYGYAIEYDAIDPTELNLSLESKKIKGLYTAGQINGTSGYEEAAAQGIIAGINASLSLKEESPIILKRNEAYIGVLIDDLINKGITEPYRLLTSRAEFRLLLRHDNADFRLTEIGRKVGLINDKKYKVFNNKVRKIEELERKLKASIIKPNKILDINNSINALELLKRPKVSINKILKHLNIKADKEIAECIEIKIKYEGYIKKANNDVVKMLKLEKKQIPSDLDYGKVYNIATEAKQKLSRVRPLTIGQATRIGGVNPSDIAMLLVYLKKEYPNE